MWTQVVRGAAAGAAGTTALDAVTYLDMAFRGRPASSTPRDTVERLSSMAGVSIGGGGDDEVRSHRLEGLGAVAGLATGVAVGAFFGAVDEALDGALRGLPGVATGLLVGGAALVGANVPMIVLGVTDPRTWTRADWASDVVPHVAYGLVTALTYAAMTD